MAGTTTRVSVATGGGQANGPSTELTISGDGTVVAYQSDATNLVGGDTNAKTDVFVHTLASGTTVRASVGGAGAEGNKGSEAPSLSEDGARVAFESAASNLVAGDTNSRQDIFVRDLLAATTIRVSLTETDGQANDLSANPSLSGAGDVVAFQSRATNLVAGDTNAVDDVFVRGPGLDAAAYTYDRLSRLTGTVEPIVGATSYTYDPVGNRTALVRAGTTTSATFDRADRLTMWGGATVSVDGAGNLVARGADSFTFDGANRLVGATVGGAGESYAYDGDGVRVSRQVGTEPAVRYVSDVNADLPVTIADGTRKYVWGLGLAYAVAGSTIEVYHPDRLG